MQKEMRWNIFVDFMRYIRGATIYIFISLFIFWCSRRCILLSLTIVRSIHFDGSLDEYAIWKHITLA